MTPTTKASNASRPRSSSKSPTATAVEAPVVAAPPPAETCPNCGSTHLIRDEIRGEIVCADCGLVVDQSALVSDRG